MGSLYELTDAARRLNELLEEGVLSEDDIRDAIINNNEEIGLKLEGYAKYIRNLEADIAGLKEEEKRLHERRSTMENAVVSMKRQWKRRCVFPLNPITKARSRRRRRCSRSASRRTHLRSFSRNVI